MKKIFLNETKQTVAILDGKSYLIELLPKKNCLHKCNGKGYSIDEGEFRPCRCIGQVHLIKRMRKGIIILGEELQKPKRKKRRGR